MLIRIFFLIFILLLPVDIFAQSSSGKYARLMQQPVRALHFVLRSVSLDDAKNIVDKAHNARFNTLLVQLTDLKGFNNAPWKPTRNAWSKRELLQWVDYVRNNGMIVVPEVKLLTHQEKFFQHNFPELMYNSATYDPREAKVYHVVEPFLDELIGAIHPRAIHIGHDEVAGHNYRSANKWLVPGEVVLPAELFLKDLLRIFDYLSKRGIQTWMWGDMLISPEEFPGMLPNHLHGTPQGYGKDLRQKIPREIVICDWHYFDRQAEFPSLATMQGEGFHVIATTWKKEQTIHNFSKYAAQHHAYGMMATTWFHVQRKEWEVVDRIIKFSGQVFSNDFPQIQ